MKTVFPRTCILLSNAHWSCGALCKPYSSLPPPGCESCPVPTSTYSSSQKMPPRLIQPYQECRRQLHAMHLLIWFCLWFKFNSQASTTTLWCRFVHVYHDKELKWRSSATPNMMEWPWDFEFELPCCSGGRRMGGGQGGGAREPPEDGSPNFQDYFTK